MNLRQLPNLISAARMLLVGPVVWALLSGRVELALLLFVVAGLSDGLDGYLARRFGWQTATGALLDPAADKLLLVASFVTLGWLGLIPGWLVGTVLARDVIITALYLQRRVAVSAKPTVISKINTFAQAGCVVLVIYAAAFGANRVFVDSWLAITLMTTVASGLLYLWLWGRRELRLRTAD